MAVAVQSRCLACDRKEPVGLKLGAAVHSIRDSVGRAVSGFFPCLNFDDECRHIGEPLGFYVFAWKPRRCRNGRLRWLKWVERHADGSFTLGDRAY